VHGPITKEFALKKLEKLNFKKGAYLIRQSAEKHGKVPRLLFKVPSGIPIVRIYPQLKFTLISQLPVPPLLYMKNFYLI
jgi:hypothetical protein